MSLLDDQISYYQRLLIAEYANAPKALATIAIYVKQALGDMLVADLGPAFDLDTAVGPQLDILGKYIGLPRTIGLPLPEPYYEFSDYAGPTPSPNGFRDYLNPATNAGVIWDNYLFQGTENTALSDVAYSFMLKMQVVLNSNDGTLASIMDFLQQFFPGQIRLIDNKDMTLTYYLGAQVPVPPQVLEPYLPKPMGVGVDFVNLQSITGVPATLSAILSSHLLPITVTSAAVTGTPTAGTGPFTYEWIWVSGTTGLLGAPLMSATSPNAATTAFTYTRNAAPPISNPPVVTAIFYLQATDSLGIPYVSGQIAVTLTANHI